MTQESLSSLVNSKTLISQPWTQTLKPQVLIPKNKTSNPFIYLSIPSNPEFYHRNEIQELFCTKNFKLGIILSVNPITKSDTNHLSHPESPPKDFRVQFPKFIIEFPKSSHLELDLELRYLTGYTDCLGKPYKPPLSLSYPLG